MKIEKNKVVVLTYELEVGGTIADKATEERPLDYIHGTNMLLPRFEEELDGKQEGDGFAFTLTPEEGYGTYEPKACFDIPKSSFVVDGKLMEEFLVIGQIVPMLNSAGQVCNASVVEVKDDTVMLDFNHPMAGKTLNFSGKVIGVRDATEKELLQGLHGEFLPQEDCCCCGHDHGDGECCHHGEGHHHGDEGCCHHGEGHCHQEN